jgi:hypothetical protein
VIAGISHVPFANESCFVPGPPQILRIENGAARNGGVVVNDAMLEGVLGRISVPARAKQESLAESRH